MGNGVAGPVTEVGEQKSAVGSDAQGAHLPTSDFRPPTSDSDRAVWIERVREAVRRADSRAFLVPARIVRRVIKRNRDIPGAGLRIPHRKSIVVAGSKLRYLVDKDELGLSYSADFPSYVFLLAEPKDSELEGMTEADLRRWAWRLLFHSRIHYEIERQIRDDELSAAEVRALIDRIGQVEFDEAVSVLEREHFLVGRPDRTEAFVEFAAVYWEFRFFAPQRVPWYFPSLHDFDAMDEILSCGLDMGQFVVESRPALDPGESAASDAEPAMDAEPEAPAKTQVGIESGPANPRRYRRLLKAAEKSAARGNTARVAIQCARAAQCSEGADREQALQRIDAELVAFTDRLQSALEFSDEEAPQWREILQDILASSLEGFWNADKRLFYDLQRVCVDHEKTVYRIDLLEWIRTLGKRPVKRELPFQKEVLSVKHLRSAIRRLNSSSISEEHRETLNHLLHEAVETAQHRLRETLRPAVREALLDVSFSPAQPSESIAFAKLVEEILDAVIKRGYVNMGVLRDAISRNQVKLEDLADATEFFRGDKLLKADRSLSVKLDGVYRRGEFYLRWLQRLSSMGFGTRIGRWLTLFVFIPFGGAFIVLNFFTHLFDKLGFEAHTLASGWTILGVSVWWIAGSGLFLLGMIHIDGFRSGVKRFATLFMRTVVGILVDVPIWAIRNPILRRIARSRPVLLFRRYVLVPAIFTLLFCVALPQFGLYAEPPLAWTIVVYMLLTAALNSRVSRDFEELTADYIEHTWYQIRVRIFVAFFEWIMGVFNAMLEFVERCLYAVDEWLRFRSGESTVTFAVKAVFGVFWAAVAFVATFCITLLIEPQINPIKHFPVVTVSHKIILPMEPMIQGQLQGALGEATAHFVAVMIVTAIPGVFGFLVWELRSNWRLYAANRPRKLRPVIVGDHGETVSRLLKPGFHSGTLPKLFGKIRREVRKHTSPERLLSGQLETAIAAPRTVGRARSAIPQKYAEALLHQRESVRHFVERDFIAVLETTDVLPAGTLRVTNVELASNNMRIDVVHADFPGEPMTIVHQEQSGRLVSGLLAAGWLRRLDARLRQHVGLALAGLFHQSGTDLVREQIVHSLGRHSNRYDVDGRYLIVWPDEFYEVVVKYDLEQRPRISPSPRRAEQEYELPSIPAQELLVTERTLTWVDWSRHWQHVADGPDSPASVESRLVLPGELRVES